MIYICIPAHEEERTIGVLLWKVRKVMAEFGRDYELVVLDDASADGTAQVLERYEGMLPLRVIRTESQVGFGPAVERLLRDVLGRSSYPKRDVAVILQADFTEDPEDLVPMVKAVEGGADLVAGFPSDEGSSLPRKLRIVRRLAPVLLGSSYAQAPVADPLSSLRAYRLIVLKKAFREVDEGQPLNGRGGCAANFEILARTAPHSRRIAETPYRARFDYRSRPSRFRIMGNLRALLALRGTRWP